MERLLFRRQLRPGGGVLGWFEFLACGLSRSDIHEGRGNNTDGRRDIEGFQLHAYCLTQ